NRLPAGGFPQWATGIRKEVLPIGSWHVLGAVHVRHHRERPTPGLAYLRCLVSPRRRHEPADANDNDAVTRDLDTNLVGRPHWLASGGSLPSLTGGVVDCFAGHADSVESSRTGQLYASIF